MKFSALGSNMALHGTIEKVPYGRTFLSRAALNSCNVCLHRGSLLYSRSHPSQATHMHNWVRQREQSPDISGNQRKFQGIKSSNSLLDWPGFIFVHLFDFSLCPVLFPPHLSFTDTDPYNILYLNLWLSILFKRPQPVTGMKY